MRRRLTALALLGIAAAGACGDPFAPEPFTDTVADTLVVYLLETASPDQPQGLNVLALEARRVSATLDFDLVFEADSIDRSLEVVPVQLIAAAGRQAGVQIVNEPFDAIERAPLGGYKYDSTVVVQLAEGPIGPEGLLTVPPEQTVLVQMPTSYCAGSVSPYTYAKLTVDSVNVRTGEVYVRGVVDPNCGFRSLLPGRPEN